MENDQLYMYIRGRDHPMEVGNPSNVDRGRPPRSLHIPHADLARLLPIYLIGLDLVDLIGSGKMVLCHDKC